VFRWGPDAEDEVGAGAGRVDALPGVVRVGAGVEADLGGTGSAVDDSEEREPPAVDERRRPLGVEVRSTDLDGQRRRSLSVALAVVAAARNRRGED
jgi:hypothetical protein